MNEKNEYTIESIKQHLPYYTGKREVSVIKYLLDYINVREKKEYMKTSTKMLIAYYIGLVIGCGTGMLIMWAYLT